MNDETTQRLADMQNRINAAAQACDDSGLMSVADELCLLRDEFAELWLDITLTIDAIAPIFAMQGGGYSGDLRLMDLCYNAFMAGRRGIPQDVEADRMDWMNDTTPLMRAGVDRMYKEAQRRMEYARADRNRKNEIHWERTNDL